jgi:hypothetical protein
MMVLGKKAYLLVKSLEIGFRMYFSVSTGNVIPLTVTQVHPTTVLTFIADTTGGDVYGLVPSQAFSHACRIGGAFGVATTAIGDIRKGFFFFYFLSFSTKQHG